MHLQHLFYLLVNNYTNKAFSNYLKLTKNLNVSQCFRTTVQSRKMQITHIRTIR